MHHSFLTPKLGESVATGHVDDGPSGRGHYLMRRSTRYRLQSERNLEKQVDRRTSIQVMRRGPVSGHDAHRTEYGRGDGRGMLSMNTRRVRAMGARKKVRRFPLQVVRTPSNPTCWMNVNDSKAASPRKTGRRILQVPCVSRRFRPCHLYIPLLRMSRGDSRVCSDPLFPRTLEVRCRDQLWAPTLECAPPALRSFPVEFVSGFFAGHRRIRIRLPDSL